MSLYCCKIRSLSIQRDHLAFEKKLSATDDQFLIDIDQQRSCKSEQRIIAWECPNLFRPLFESPVNPFQKIRSPDFLPEHRRKRPVIHQSVLEPVNCVSGPGESTFIELNCVLQQSAGIREPFPENFRDLLVIFSGTFLRTAWTNARGTSPTRILETSSQNRSPSWLLMEIVSGGTNP